MASMVHHVRGTLRDVMYGGHTIIKLVEKRFVETTELMFRLFIVNHVSVKWKLWSYIWVLCIGTYWRT